MKKAFLISAISIALYACGSGTNTKESSDGASTESSSSASSENPSYDPNRGEGKFSNMDIPTALNKEMAASGESIYGVKCSSCHKTSDEKLVGPGWKGVTQRRKPEWIMNFITNPDPMIDKDPAVQAQLEICLVRMPNQGLTDDDARHVFEFMRKNDGVN